MNELAKLLNAAEREHLEKLIAMDVNDMLDSNIAALKARVMYLTDEVKARFPFLSEAKPKAKKAADIQAE